MTGPGVRPAPQAATRPAGAPRPGDETARLDAFKGLFILLIVAGHNHTLEAVAGEARGGLYLVHVAMFLLLPFLRPRSTWSRLGWADGLVRYGWPMVVFCTLYTGLFATFSGRSLGEALVGIPYALVAMSARVFEDVSGLQILWFLPALIGIRFALKLLGAPGAPSLRVLLPLALAAHLTVGLLPEAWLVITPLGWPIVAYMLFPGLLVYALHEGGFRIPLRYVGPALLVAVLLAVVYRHAGPILGARPSPPLYSVGKLEIPSIAEPARLLAADAAQVIVLFSALTLCGLSWLQVGLTGFGRRSLEIFLFHQPIYIALLTLARKLGGAPGDVATGLLLFCLTVALSFTAAQLLAGYPRVRALLFPQGAPRLRDLTALKRAGSRGLPIRAGTSNPPAAR
ncbi:acyltransferase [Methylobacterium sp. J-070]|uniref:acyltransferase n=1 Tax=Methylobacterium sp. J-070 TaxID=2836650 RepID=UPI001FB89551|nr:acyltransferase [Methylobacterium sp. J-070]MCJ2053873.1 acyltransferase [Methylobacterium sp. J-070]